MSGGTCGGKLGEHVEERVKGEDEARERGEREGRK